MSAASMADAGCAMSARDVIACLPMASGATRWENWLRCSRQMKPRPDAGIAFQSGY